MNTPVSRAPLLAPTRGLVAVHSMRWCLAAALLLVGPATALAQSPLSLATALELAEHRSLSLRAQDLASAAASDMAVAAGRLPDPVLRMSLDNVPIDGPMRFSLSEDFMTMRSVGLTQTFTGADKRQARSARFEREADVAHSRRALELATLRRDTALAWFDHYYRNQLVELLERQREESTLQIQAAEAAYRAGKGAQADVFAARSAVAGIDDAMLDARARRENAAYELARWIGDEALAPPGAAPDLAHTRFDARWIEQHPELHPGVALQRAGEAVAQARAEVARTDRSADWSVSLMYSQRGSAFSDMVSVGVSIPLQWDRKNRQDREYAASLARAEQARAEREEITREYHAELRRWHTSWRANLQRLAEYETTLIPLAAERTQAVMAGYRGGKSPLSEVLAARGAEIDTRIGRLRIEMETAALWARLEYLIADSPAARPADERALQELTP